MKNEPDKAGGRMNYIPLLLDFRAERRKKPIGKNAILLYFILWEYINEYRLPTERFSAPNSVLQANSGLSRRDLDSARNELKLNGYIDYKKGSGNQSGIYLIVRFDTRNDTQFDTRNDTQTDTQIHHINITKQDKTKLNKDLKELGANAPTPPRDTAPAVKRFIKPTVDEVRTFCRERKSSVDAQRFVDYYDSVGWMVGKKAMKDWRAAVRTWEKREESDHQRASRSKPSGNMFFELADEMRNGGADHDN